MVVVGGTKGNKHRRQHKEHVGLYGTNEQLKQHKRQHSNRGKVGRHVGHSNQQHLARKHVTEQTQAKREEAGKFRNQL